MRKTDYLAMAIKWNESKDPQFPYRAVVDGKPLTLRLNDFPAENLYTLIADATEISFDDWPSAWTKNTRKAPKRSSRFKAPSPNRLVKA